MPVYTALIFLCVENLVKWVALVIPSLVTQYLEPSVCKETKFSGHGI